MNEKLLATDILSQPIPIEARLTFAEIDEGHVAWRHAAAIARSLDVHENTVRRNATFLGLPYKEEHEPSSGKNSKYYPPYAESVINEELEWKKTYNTLPSRVNATTIAENIARSYGWTAQTLIDLGLQPGKDGLYPRTAVNKLRHICMFVPMDDGWYNLAQLELITGANREWIERRLAEAGHEAQHRRSSLTGRILVHYDPSSAQTVLQALKERPSAAGDWLTNLAIARLSGRTEKWSKIRLEPHSDLGLIKLDDMNVPRIHWSPGIARMLIEESERLRLLPDGNNFLNISKFARKLGHVTNRVVQILDEMGIQAQEYRDKKGRPQLGHNRSLIPKVSTYYKKEHEKYPVTNDLLLDSLFAVGSLRSKIRLQHKKISALTDAGYDDRYREVKLARIEIKNLEESLRKTRAKHHRLIRDVKKVPEFLNGALEED